MVTSKKRILVPLDLNSNDLKSLYHALALAERVVSRIFILCFDHPPAMNPDKDLIKETYLDIIHTACEEGLDVSVHLSEQDTREELISIVQSEHIDIIIIDAENEQFKTIIRNIMPLIPCQIIQVGGKDRINYLQ